MTISRFDLLQHIVTVLLMEVHVNLDDHFDARRDGLMVRWLGGLVAWWQWTSHLNPALEGEAVQSALNRDSRPSDARWLLRAPSKARRAHCQFNSIWSLTWYST